MLTHNSNNREILYTLYEKINKLPSYIMRQIKFIDIDNVLVQFMQKQNHLINKLCKKDKMELIICLISKVVANHHCKTTDELFTFMIDPMSNENFNNILKTIKRKHPLLKEIEKEITFYLLVYIVLIDFLCLCNYEFNKCSEISSLISDFRENLNNETNLHYTCMYFVTNLPECINRIKEIQKERSKYNIPVQLFFNSKIFNLLKKIFKLQ